MSRTGQKRKRTSTRVTLEDIARHCGVSRASVAQVLNRHGTDFPLSEGMIQRVEAAIEELGYRPNRLARALGSDQTHLIALSHIHVDFQLLTPDQVTYVNQVTGQFTRNVFRHPGFKDYDLVIHERRESEGRPLKPSDFKPDLFDGMIYLTPSEGHSEFLDVASKDFPIILLGQTDGAEEKVPCIDINNRKMASRAVEHLIGLGRRSILMLIPEKLQHLNCIGDRLQGYRDALTENGIQISGELIRTVRSLEDNVNTFFGDLRCLGEVDAIFCANDDLAALCIKPLQAMEYRIPEDIALMGFSDAPFCQHTTPPLSSVHLPVGKQFYAATDLLLKILKKEVPYEPGFHEIESDLVIRASTRPT
ncbi:MAG: hypothetical protein DRP64_03875 [Verrucomicrobia bacterium]|nr:MAG: hypothetical protein DRP64_03875 [Verrucomicrobiota bacterium]